VLLGIFKPLQIKAFAGLPAKKAKLKKRYKSMACDRYWFNSSYSPNQEYLAQCSKNFVHKSTNIDRNLI
jgi:hypothetical protein